MEKKTFSERYKNDILSDNSQVENCKQCKDCALRDDGTVYSNNYQKCCCLMFQHPRFKPLEIIENKALCPFYKKVTQSD